MAEARGDVYYSEPTDTTRGMRSYREGPPPRARAQERRLDITPDSCAAATNLLKGDIQRSKDTRHRWTPTNRASSDLASAGAVLPRQATY
jgi:hypothetical protein